MCDAEDYAQEGEKPEDENHEKHNDSDERPAKRIKNDKSLNDKQKKRKENLSEENWGKRQKNSEVNEALNVLIDYENVLISQFNISYARNNALVGAHLSIHSLAGKYDDLLELMNVLNEKNLFPGVLLLCETFVSEKNYTKLTFHKYDLISEYSPYS